MSRVLLIGLDGATFDVIHPLVDQGRLPNLSYLLEQGAWGVLRSAIPPITPTAWTSVFTGKNPGKHGIYNFQEIDRTTYRSRPVRSDRHQEATLWQMLGEADKTSVVIDVPYTFPPQPLQGVMITGYGTPRTPGTVFTYPETLADDLPSALRSEVRVALPPHTFERNLEIVQAWKEIMQGRRALLKHLMATVDWDFFFTVFTITDYLAHAFWTFLEPAHPNHAKPEAQAYREAFFGAYEQCDALIGELMAAAGPDTTTLIMSDHGFGSIYPRQFMFRKLAEGGFVHFQSPPALSLFGDRLMKTAMRAYTGLPFLREWVKNMRPQRQKSMRRALARGGLMPSMQAIDAKQSQIIPSNFSLQLWINARDRFASGVVAPEQEAPLLDALSHYLLSIRDGGSQRPVVSAVYRGTEIYQGPAAAVGPDLVLEYNNFYQPGQPPTAPNPRLEGGHTMQGIFLAHGPNTVPGKLDHPSLIDLAPTILHLLGQPIPSDLDGHVLAEAFSPEFMAASPVRVGARPARRNTSSQDLDADFTPEEEAEVETQLRQLGYID